MTVGVAIRERRVGADLSQGELAERVGVGQRVVSRWEAGAARPGLAELEGLAGVFGCRVSDLVRPVPYPSAPVDPEARREFFARRNAKLQGIDGDAAVERMRAGFEARVAARARVPEG